MFDLAGFFTRDSHHDTAAAPAPAPSAVRPANYLVHKNGKPFVILNATPALAERTVAGFMTADPQACWSFERA